MNTQPKRILILEDDRDMCQELTEILKEEGFSVDTAFDGNSAKEMMRRDSHAIYLLDIKVPGISGLELLKQIKSRSPQAKVIMLSAHPALSRFLRDGGDGEEFDTLKLADAVISKPFHVEQLLDTIRKLILP